MGEPVVFLDIDGVLNNTPCLPRGPRILPEQAERLETLLDATGADVVLTTSWRKWLWLGHMNLVGFALLLHTHGIHISIAGSVDPGPPEKRAELIRRYVSQHGVERYVVLDDEPLDVPNLIQTDGTKGLTCRDVVEAYKTLRDT